MTRSRLLALLLLLNATAPLPAQRMTLPDAAELERLPAFPQKLPTNWLAPGEHPRVVLPKERLTPVREKIKEDALARAFLEEQRTLAEPFLTRSARELYALVPPPGSETIYGLGMNLGPRDGKPLRWSGWGDPFSVTDTKGRRYPNAEEENARFIAIANGAIFQELEERVLPALAHLYGLEGDEKAATAAAHLLDALSAAYAADRRGPLDYPIPEELSGWGGRLNRAHYMVARGLANYVEVIDLITPSGALEAPSAYRPAGSIREQVIRHLLWDGALYCLTFARQSTLPDNGTVDWLRGAACVGVLLGEKRLLEPMVEGPLAIHRLVTHNIDRNGFYYESAPGYENYTRKLYLDVAELLEAARRTGLTQTPSLYALPEMQAFLDAPFDRRELSGKLPLMGDSALDLATVDPRRRFPQGKRVYTDAFLDDQIVASWRLLVRAPEKSRGAAHLLATLPVNAEAARRPAGAWAFYHVEGKHLDTVHAAQSDTASEPASALYGAKGLALLRGGAGEKRHGAQLFFGPLHSHAQAEALTWTFFADGSEWSMDPGRFNTHLRMGWTRQSVAHQAVLLDGVSHAFQAGGGWLTAWQGSGEVQWAAAQHQIPDRTGALHPLRRLIAQVDDPETGRLLYWLDLSEATGGTMRDESFHTVAPELSTELDLKPTGQNALFGEIDLGRALRNDGRLRDGIGEAGFYWEAPGHGYGFLGSPRSAPMEKSLRLRFSDPRRGTLVADLDGGPGRELFVADGPTHNKLPAVPYVIRREKGEGRSLFAKVLSFEHSGASPVREPLRRLSSEGGAAWEVPLANGARDLWIYAQGPTVIRDASLPAIETDAHVAFLRFNAKGKLEKVAFSAASYLKAGEKAFHQPAQLTGKLTALHHEAGRLRWEVEWEPESFAQWKKNPALSAPMATSRFGEEQPATWSVRAFQGTALLLDDTKAEIGRFHLHPSGREADEMEADLLPGRFGAPHRLINYGYAAHRPLLLDGIPVATIGTIAEEGRRVHLRPLGQTALPKSSAEYTIAEALPGATLTLPVNLIWRADDARHSPKP